MSENLESENLENSQEETVKEEINLQFHWYLFGFFTTYLMSWFFPGILLYFYFALYYIPNFLLVGNLLYIFQNFSTLLAFFSLPFVLLGTYLLHVFLVALITRIFWRITEKIKPSKDGKIPRNIPSKTLNYYHIRSFLIKYPKHLVVKGLFPWLINWVYNFIGSNKIGKGTTIEEQFGADKFIETGENCYIGVNSGFSSHAVDGIFGNVDYFKITLGDNVTTAGLNCLAPGVEIKDDAYLFPMAGATKHNVIKGDGNYYFGVPLRKIFTRKTVNYLDVEKDVLEAADNLRTKKVSDSTENDE
jgi:acetyltransferase-like isoleucine patch superfamily enzyme